MTSVLICDERRGVREGLGQFMSAVPGVGRVDTVATGEELLERFPHEKPDVVLVGTQRAVDTGIITVRRMVSQYPKAAVLVFGAPDDAQNIVAAVACGARGYLRWDASHAEVCAALAHALAGVELSSRVPLPRQAGDVVLTQRELQVLHGMSQGKSNSQIGRELFLSEDTVKTHARRLFKKLGVNDRAQAVACGFRRGLVS
ncbi:MAG TPA: response regulator transcription factor [Mycobacteriales bacterium]|nr:response regulator transcription factor [Mycobacteriales bacterium]